MNRISIAISFFMVLVSCKSHFIRTKISKPANADVIGITVQLGEMEDTTIVSNELNEFLIDCKYVPLNGLFKKEIYQKKNYDLLFNMDSTFIASQPGLNNLTQLLVCKLELIEKKDESSSKNNVWITFLGRWIQLKPVKKLHDFYYLEKVNYTGTAEDAKMLLSFIVAQMHVKFCFDVQKYILKKN